MTSCSHAAMERLDVGPGETLLPEQFPDSSLMLTEKLTPCLIHQLPLSKTKVEQSRRLKQSGKRIWQNFWMSLSSLSGIPISIGSAGVTPTPATIMTLDPLRPDVLLNDVRTLITEAERQTDSMLSERTALSRQRNAFLRQLLLGNGAHRQGQGLVAAIRQPLITAQRSIPGGTISSGEANSNATRLFRLSQGPSDRFHAEKPTAHIA